MHISATHHQGYQDVKMVQTHPKSLKQYQLQTYSKKKEHRFAGVPGKTLQLKAKKIILSSYVELFL
jgi:hypothetical protein